MTLVDTSVIDYLRAGDARLQALFLSLPGGICGITGAEVLHGTRNMADRARLIAVLDASDQILLPDALWDSVGDLLASLRANGVSVPFNDAVLASLAISAGVELWTRDTQFQLIRQVEPRLLLFQEPP